MDMSNKENLVDDTWNKSENKDNFIYANYAIQGVFINNFQKNDNFVNSIDIMFKIY